MSKYPMIDKFKLDLITSAGNHDAILAAQVEVLLSSGKVASGFGNETQGSIIYGPDIDHSCTDITALVLGIEFTKVEPIENAQSLAQNLLKALDYRMKPIDITAVSELAEKLAKLVLNDSN
jgi:hypothetical protein